MVKLIDVKILDSRVTEEHLKPKTPGSAGIDLFAVANEPIILNSGECKLIGTRIAIHINDPGYAGFVLPRSGLGGNRGLVLGNLVGLIDSDYQGEIKIFLWNRSEDRIKIEPMSRVTQLVIMPVANPYFNIVEEFEQSERGEGGFGHTGI